MTLLESKLGEFILDLHENYISIVTKVQGRFILFSTVDSHTDWHRAKRKLEHIFAKYNIHPVRLQITPGPEIKRYMNRGISMLIDKDELL